MTQRTMAGLMAALLLGALVAWIVFRPMPYVTLKVHDDRAGIERSIDPLDVLKL